MVETAGGGCARPRAPESAPFSIPSLDLAPLGGSVRSPVWAAADQRRRLEFGSVPEHRMHEAGQRPNVRDPRLAHGGALGIASLILQLQHPSTARQHDVRCLMEQRSHPPDVAPGDAAGAIDLAGLEAGGIIAGGREGKRGEMINARDRHQPAACPRRPWPSSSCRH